jgi:hypothetical protein
VTREITSLVARQELFREFTSDVAVVLITVEHASLDAPIYLSSDATEMITRDPLVYGTRSRGNVYQFVFVGTVMSSDQAEGPRAAQLQFDDLSGDIGRVLQELVGIATATLELVRSTDPDTVEERYTNLQFTTSSGEEQTIAVQVERKSGYREPWPAHRQIKNFAPGIHR